MARKLRSKQHSVFNTNLHQLWDNYSTLMNPDVSASTYHIESNGGFVHSNISKRTSTQSFLVFLMLWDDCSSGDIFDRCIVSAGVEGRRLNPVCRNPTDSNRISDKLLRWHFRQSVLGQKGIRLPRVEQWSWKSCIAGSRYRRKRVSHVEQTSKARMRTLPVISTSVVLIRDG